MDLTEGDAPGSDFVLVNGDAQQDNAVHRGDLSAVLYYFGTRYPSVDLDENEVVDLDDVSMVLLALGTEGDP